MKHGRAHCMDRSRIREIVAQTAGVARFDLTDDLAYDPLRRTYKVSEHVSQLDLT